jgi:hypothetical protein
MQKTLLPHLLQMKSLDGTWIKKYFDIDGEIATNIIQLLLQKKESSEFNINFKLWEREFFKLYPKDEVKLDLFHKHCILICAIVTVFHLKQSHYSQIELNDPNKIDNPESNNGNKKSIREILNLLQIPSYLSWIFNIPEIIEQLDHICHEYKNYKIIPIDLFFEIYQTLLFDNTRHQMGEFYTHSQLAEMMVKESYQLHSFVIDPACGSGMFLLSISSYLQTLKLSEDARFKALNKIYGMDRNPLACIMARTNLLLQNFDLFIKYKWRPDISESNSLFIAADEILSKLDNKIGFDLIIGNPPWVVLNRLSDKKEKDQVKQLGNDLGILCGGKLATSTELTTIFIARMVRDFLSPNGTIFFVTPASLATGAQHGKFRNFFYLQNIEFWAFDKDIFKIHNLCFKAQKNSSQIIEKVEVNWKIFHCELDPIRVQLKTTEIYGPQSIRTDSKTNERIMGRLGKKVTNQSQENSFYQSRFRQGASLVPRNLLFIEIIEKKGNLIQIKPAETIQNKKYRTWEFDAYKNAEVEEQYIFKVAKSTGIMPFHYEMSDWAFLPLNIETHNFSIVSPKAATHLCYLEQIYSENMKEGAEIKSLLKRLDYGHALSDSRQLTPFKIIYGGIGSIVKAAILRENFIIDTSLYYYLPESEEEAYYLLGFLNSELVTQYVKKVGSTGANGSLRNIHKHPLDLSLPNFDLNKKTHIDLSEYARQMETYVNEFIKEEKIRSDKHELTLKMIQKRLFIDTNYRELLKKLDEFVEKILISSHYEK